MAVPKRKVSPSRRNMRRAHDSLGSNPHVEDKDTGELRRSHHIDLKTGTYRGRQVLTPKEDSALPGRTTAEYRRAVHRAPFSCVHGGEACSGDLADDPFRRRQRRGLVDPLSL